MPTTDTSEGYEVVATQHQPPSGPLNIATFEAHVKSTTAIVARRGDQYDFASLVLGNYASELRLILFTAADARRLAEVALTAADLLEPPLAETVVGEQRMPEDGEPANDCRDCAWAHSMSGGQNDRCSAHRNVA